MLCVLVLGLVNTTFSRKEEEKEKMEKNIYIRPQKRLDLSPVNNVPAAYMARSAFVRTPLHKTINEKIIATEKKMFHSSSSIRACSFDYSM